jgi:hypothetical protein
MVKLIRSIAAMGLTCLPYLLITIRARWLTIQVQLDRALHIFTEFPALIINITVYRHLLVLIASILLVTKNRRPRRLALSAPLPRQAAEALDFGLLQFKEFLPGIVLSEGPGDPVNGDHQGRSINVLPGDVHRVRFRLKMRPPPGPEDVVELQFVEFIPGLLQEFQHLGFFKPLIAIIELIIFHSGPCLQKIVIKAPPPGGGHENRRIAAFLG